ncbi:hypothetical protein C8F01DRAFT_1255130 [Mycena amicta]|nr:hypothetical protein C8F01DRAFT_1255130 [Mycena amicta]
MHRRHDHAHTHNLRVILWNRREYRGSTPYSDTELLELAAGKQSPLDKHAMELAWFFEHLIDVENIPQLSVDRKHGGIILVGWSFGVATVLTLLAAQEVLPKHSQLYAKIEQYFKGVVLYGGYINTHPAALGLPVPDDFYDPLSDPDCPTTEGKFENFKFWVSSYGKHPDLASRTRAGISCRVKRTERCTVESWTEEETLRYVEKAAAARSEFAW